MKTTRRSFIASITSFFAVAAVTPSRAFAADDATRLIYKLAILVPDRSAAALLGREYLALAQDESAADKLADLVCGSSADVRKQVVESTPGARRKILEQLIAQDFDKGQTVKIHGWVLARTEARLYALVAATPPTTP
jgi:hypothetical protein